MIKSYFLLLRCATEWLLVDAIIHKLSDVNLELKISKYIAHVRSNGTIQSLETHLTEVSELTSKLANKIGCPNAGALIGLMHDFGKYSASFQTYLQFETGLINPDKDDYVNAKGQKGKIDHSTAGAQWVYQQLFTNGGKAQKELCAQILFMCIASHHSGLIDCLDLDGNNKFDVRRKKPEEEAHLAECIENSDASILNNANDLANQKLVQEMWSLLKPILENTHETAQNARFIIQEFYLGMVTKFLFSCLIDADRINSADFEYPEQKELRSNILPDWDIAINRLNEKLTSFLIKNDVDKIRKNISDNCELRANDKQGLFTLSVPTGGGKTLASLRFALNHAKKHQLERIIYIIPYTSIIEQNAGEVRTILERDGERQWVLEHHSNIEPEIQTWHSKLAAENWDLPIIFTTMVQFLESLFGSGTRGVRRLHQLANSVLIFDEIQTLPINCVHLFCNSLNFLTTYAKTTAVLCTATQPLLNALKAPNKGQLNIPSENELVGDSNEVLALFNQLERVEIDDKTRDNEKWSCDEISNLAINEFKERNSCLIIVNTKDWAQKLFSACAINVDNIEIFHLSTNQCPAHRKLILDIIRQRLKDGLPVLCISTQLIEAGVDISFSCVIRFLAGLDSIAQAAGRCNRHGELKDNNGQPIKGKVIILKPDDENIDLLTEIKIGQEKAERVLNDSDITPADLLSPKGIERYFKYYFYERADEMVYKLPQKNTNILNLLSDNCGNNYKYKNNVRRKKRHCPLLMQSFKEAGNTFKAIDAPTQAVIVEYGEGKSIVTELCRVYSGDRKEYAKLLQQAQKFSVNVFPNIWKKLVEEQAVMEIQGEGIYYLREEYYSEAFGLSTERVGVQSFLYCD